MECKMKIYVGINQHASGFQITAQQSIKFSRGCSRHCKPVLISGQNRLFCYRSTNQSHSTYRRGHKLLISFSVCQKENHFIIRYWMPQNTFLDMLTAILVK